MDDLFGFLILGSMIALIVGLVKPGVFSRFIKNPTRKKVGLILGGLLFVSFIGLGMTADTKTATSTTETTQTQPTSSLTSKDEKLNYEILSIEENKVIEHIAVLVEKTEMQGEAIAMEVKKTCKKPCNIDIWNSREVYASYKQYENLSGDSKMPLTQIEQHKEQNYVKWGDSLIGSIDFETNSYNDNPLQDWHYKELKDK